MRGTADGGRREVGSYVDESKVTPTAKAYVAPLQPADEVRLEFTVGPDQVSLGGRARVAQGLAAAVNFTAVGGLTLLTVAVVVLLCDHLQAPGELTLALAAASSGLILALGLYCTRTKSSNPASWKGKP